MCPLPVTADILARAATSSVFDSIIPHSSHDPHHFFSAPVIARGEDRRDGWSIHDEREREREREREIFSAPISAQGEEISNAIKSKKRSDAEKFLLGKPILCTVNLHACMLLDCESALVPV